MKTQWIFFLLWSIMTLSTGCHSGKETNDSSATVAPVEVRLSKLHSDSSLSSNELSVGGRLEAFQSTQLSSRVMGLVTSLHVREGKPVKKGQTLVRIQSTDLQAQRARLNANLSEAQAAYQNAEVNYQRFKALFEQSSATSFELDQAKMNFDMAKSRVLQVKHGIEQVDLLIREADVVAPFDGHVTSLHTEVGMMANPGMPLLSVETTQRLLLKVMVPESEIQYIDSKQPVQVSFPQKGDQWQTRILTIHPSNASTGSQYAVDLEVPTSLAKERTWKPGMYANATFIKRLPASVKTNPTHLMSIPKSALVTKGQLHGIYTVSSEQTAILRWIRIGKDLGDRVEVLSGLQEGEQYVVESDGKLFNGAGVLVK